MIKNSIARFKAFTKTNVFKRSFTGCALILVIFMGIVGGGSLAYKVREERTSNKISAGEIKVNLVNILPGKHSEDDYSIYGILPGKTYENKVYVQNTCDYDEYIRVTVSKKINTKDGKELSAEPVYPNYNEKDWEYKDGYYYYKKVLPARAASSALYDELFFDEKINNEYKTATLNMLIVVEAVQSVHNGSNPLEAQGWEVKVAPSNNTEPVTDK